MLELETRWMVLAVCTSEDGKTNVLYKDPAGRHENPIISILNKSSQSGFNFFNNKEGTCNPNESGVISLTWLQTMMGGLSSERNGFISGYSCNNAVNNQDLAKLKTDLKLMLITDKIHDMLSQIQITEETRLLIRKCIELSNIARDKLGEPVNAYQQVLKNELDKLEADPNYTMDKERIMKAQKNLTGKLGQDEIEGMENLVRIMIPEYKCSSDKNKDESDKSKEQRKHLTVFQDCMRMLNGAEETEGLREILNVIGRKFGVNGDELIEYFCKLPKKDSLVEDNTALEVNLEDLESQLPPVSENNFIDPSLKTITQLLAEFAEETEFDEIILSADADQEKYFKEMFNGNSGILEIKAHYYEIMNLFETWKDADIRKIHSWASQNKGRLISFVEGAAVLDRVFQLTSGGSRLRASQMLSVISFMRTKDAGKLAQICTGEGKTVIIAFIACLKILQKETVVDILTSNEVLAQEGAKEMKTFYEILGITVAVNNAEKSKKTVTGERHPRTCYAADIVYGTITNFQFDFLRHTSEGEMTRGSRPFGVVILDEVDNLSVDNGGNIAKLAKPFPGMECLKYVYIKIWQELIKAEGEVAEEYVHKLEGKSKELEAQEKKERDPKSTNDPAAQHKDGQLQDNEGSKEDGQFHEELILGYVQDLKDRILKSDPLTHTTSVVYPHLRPYCKSMLSKWIDNGLFAKYECRENEMYVIKKVEGQEVIVPVDHSNTGVTMQNTQWSNGLHQFVQLKHNLRLTSESLTSSFISNIGYIKLYQRGNIFGLTGTLGSAADKEMLHEAYGVEFSVIPRYKKYKLSRCEDLVVEDQDWANLVSIQAFIYAVARSRSVLVICNTIKELEIVRKNAEACLFLEGHSKDVKLKVYMDEDQSSVVNESVGQREIIIATNIAGRGTNFKTTKELEASGGLHVIVSFLPYNKRVQDQAFGRTARQGNGGSAQLIFKESDVLDIGLETRGEDKLTMSTILERRDEMERARLAKVKAKKLQEINFNDNLFSKVANLFAFYSEKMRNIPGGSFVTADLKEFWAFWLHKQDFGFDKIKTTTVEKEFEVFFKEVKNILEHDQVIWNPFNEIRRSERFLQIGSVQDAVKAVRRGINMCGDMCASGYMQLFEIEIEKGGQLMERFKKALASLILIPVEKDESYKVSAKAALEKVVKALDHELAYINTNFYDEKSNRDFQLIITRNENNLFLNYLNGRYTALSTFHQHANSLIERIDQSNNRIGIAMGSRVPHYLKKLDENKPDEKPLKDALMPQELDELQAVGLSTIYSLRNVHDASEEVIIGAQGLISSGLLCTATGILFSPAMVVLGPTAGALISEGVCDIVIELLSKGDTGFDVASYVKGKCISFGIALATMGIGAVATSVTVLTKASKACVSLAKLLEKCKYLKSVCTRIANQLKRLGKYFDKLKLTAQFGKMKDAEKLGMLRQLLAAGEVEKLKSLGGLAELRRLKNLQSIGKLGCISRVHLLTSTATTVCKSTVQSVTMNLITEHLVTAGLDRVLDGLCPWIEARVREGVFVLTDHLNRMDSREQVESTVINVLNGSYGEIATDVIKEISLGVVRNSSNWKLKLASLAIDNALCLGKICTYTASFCDKFKVAAEQRDNLKEEKLEKDKLSLDQKKDVVITLVTNKVYQLIVELARKNASHIVVAPMVSKLMGMKFKNEDKKETIRKLIQENEDNQTLSQISEAYDTLELRPGATQDDVYKAYRKAASRTHPDRPGGDHLKFLKVRSAYELITNLHEEVSSSLQEGTRFIPALPRGEGGSIPPGRESIHSDVKPAREGENRSQQPEGENITTRDPGDGGNIATICSTYQQCIVVKCFDKHGIVKMEKVFGARWKSNGKPHAVIGYIPGTDEQRIGHFFPLNGEITLSNSIPSNTSPNNCLYDSLASQICGGALCSNELRLIAEQTSAANSSYAVVGLAVKLLKNPITRKLYKKAQRGLLVGGCFDAARYARDKYVEVVKHMGLQFPESDTMSLLKACKGESKDYKRNNEIRNRILNAIKAIKDHSCDKVKKTEDPSKINICVFKIKNLDNLTSFILNHVIDPNPKNPGDPFAIQYPNGVTSVFGGDLYSLIAYDLPGDISIEMGTNFYVGSSQYHGKGLGNIIDGIKALTDPKTKIVIKNYHEISGRLISECMRNKSTLMSACLGLLNNSNAPLAGIINDKDTSEGKFPITAETGIEWIASDKEDAKNPDYLLRRNYEWVKWGLNKNYLEVLRDVLWVFAPNSNLTMSDEDYESEYDELKEKLKTFDQNEVDKLLYSGLYKTFRDIVEGETEE